MFVLSSLYSTLPALTSLIAFLTSRVTVPLFGFGIRPRGPKTLAILPTKPIISGVVIQTSKSNHPPWIFAIISSAPTISAPALVASSALSPLAITKTLTFLPVPAGRTTVPLTCWSALLPSTPSLTWSSTVSSNLALAFLITTSNASAASYVLLASYAATHSLYLFPNFIKSSCGYNEHLSSPTI